MTTIIVHECVVLFVLYVECVGSREDFDSTCSTTSGYSSTVTDMSATAGGGGGKGDKEAEGEGESRGVVDMTEEVAFTPPDGGLRVSKLGLTEVLVFKRPYP